ncbi:MAG: aspartate kinase [Sulfobacillus benefaciens]|uniref:Aspartokinase n=1 Tax=Sulfobacillus benefaciens TaxID=453960 RepID=A0A2T2XLV4_9FIRM|nr:MAG: aspartate kinase [Sulfobacillus benefaciens]
MRVSVQKFGGTSVRDFQSRERATTWVSEAFQEGRHPVVVVSAMGRRGDPYATDSLLDLLANFTQTPAEEQDLLMMCGEVISAVVMAGHLRNRGLRPRVFLGGDAGIITDETFGDAQILEVDPLPLEAALEEECVPVIAGFQGKTRSGAITTLGRGGSDTTAVAVGAALNAEVVEIFTDVDGIKTADPRIVPQARTITRMNYDEVFQLANLGARVVHPRAVEIARQFGVPLRVRSTFSDQPGTLVLGGRRTMDPWAHRDPDHAVTGITQLEDLVQFVVRQDTNTRSEEWAYHLFTALGNNGVSVDLINMFPDTVFFCVSTAAADSTEKTLQQLSLDFDTFRDRAKVSVVGSAIQGLPGVVGRVMAALSQHHITVLQSADSHSTITLLLYRNQMEQAVAALHHQFGLGVEEG